MGNKMKSLILFLVAMLMLVAFTNQSFLRQDEEDDFEGVNKKAHAAAKNAVKNIKSVKNNSKKLSKVAKLAAKHGAKKLLTKSTFCERKNKKAHCKCPKGFEKSTIKLTKRSVKAVMKGKVKFPYYRQCTKTIGKKPIKKTGAKKTGAKKPTNKTGAKKPA